MGSTRLVPLAIAALALMAGACGSDSSSSSTADARKAPDASQSPADSASGPADAGIDAQPAESAIKHVVVIVQENHTFDNHFGNWCTAPAYSEPTCTTGPSCCEAAPDADPSGTAPIILDDDANGGYDPDHSQPCEIGEINGGAMDRFASGESCSDARNIAVAPNTVVARYHTWASENALADRYFQPIAGSSSANDMYFAEARHVFTDNEFKPDTNGAGCILPRTRIQYTGKTTLADLLINAGESFAFYAEGYERMVSSLLCPAPPSDCPLSLPTTPCDYDPSDIPFEYYEQFADNALYMKDYADLARDINAGQLPSVAFIKNLGYHNEHPGYGTSISAGIDQVEDALTTIAASFYADSTLILIVWDEGGGYFDHVAPPATSAVDNQPYGTRVPLLAIGPFAKKGTVSHVPMEHSSIVKFIEWNFLDDTGQLGARDAEVNNIGSLLDPAATGRRVPER